MNKYLKKVSIMFVMLLAIIGVGMLQYENVAKAADKIYIPKEDYSQNLVTDYKFEETSGTTCVDFMGNYNGTYNGTTSGTDTTEASTNNYRTFNGTSDYIKVNYNIIPIGKKTIKFKLKTTQTSIGNILTNTNKSNGYDNKQFTIHTNNGKINVGVNNGDFEILNLMSNKSVNDDEWHTIMITYDTSILKIYIDDMITPDSSVTGSGNEATSYNAFSTFGFYFPASGYYRYYNGALDDVEIYDDVVEYEEKSISLDHSSMDLTEGDSAELTATTTPAEVGVTWAVSDPTVASIEVDTTNGKITKITALKEGTCTITATTADGNNLSASCIINVTKKDTTDPNTPPDDSDNKTGAILIINLTDGETKVFDISASEAAKFKEWYNTKTEYENQITYEFDKTVNSSISVEEDVVHDQVTSYEIRKY